MLRTERKRAKRLTEIALGVTVLAGILCGCIYTPGPEGYQWTALDDKVLGDGEILGMPVSTRPSVLGGGEGGAAPGNYYLVKKDGIYGLLTIDGEWMFEPMYQTIAYGFDYYLKEAAPSGKEYFLDASGNLQEDEGAWPKAMGTGVSGSYGWDPDAQRFWFGQDGYFWAQEGEPAGVIPVRQMRLQEQQPGQEYAPLVPTAEDWERRNDPDFNLEALCVNRQLVTDFVYEKIAAQSGGLFAVKQDGKWGYLNAAGELVIPCAYDGCRSDSPSSPDEWEERGLDEQTMAEYLESWEDDKYASPCMGGYVVLYLDGQAALYTDEGEQVIPFGVFEELTEVTDGRCFAKYNGKWGVLDLDGTART